MTDGVWTPQLTQLLADLRTDQDLQRRFRSDPKDALSGYKITAHERDALVSRDLDDLVTLGVADSFDQLPDVVQEDPATGDSGPQGNLDRLMREINSLRERLAPWFRLPRRPGR
jgi:hypothetical protein